MRRLVTEFPLATLKALGYGPLLEGWDLVSLHVLRHEKNAVTVIARLRPQGPGARIEDLASHSLVQRAKILRVEGDEWVVLGVLKVPRTYSRLTRVPGVWFERVTTVGKDRFRLSVVSEEPVLRRLLDMSRAAGLRFRVVRIEDVDGEADPLRALTHPQRRVLRAAFDMGFFDSDRKANLEDIARLFCQNRSSVMETLRRAQRNLIAEVLQPGDGG